MIQFLPNAQFHLTPNIHFSLVYVMLGNKNGSNKVAGFTASQKHAYCLIKVMIGAWK